jgi:hypothetical protein
MTRRRTRIGTPAGRSSRSYSRARLGGGAGAPQGTAEEEVGYEVCLSLSTLFSRSIPTRYLLRNLWPTILPS